MVSVNIYFYNLSELYLLQDLTNETTHPYLRYAKKYNVSRSPLEFIKWWRICFDTSQKIEYNSSSMSKIISHLEFIHKWVINGTPIRKSLNSKKNILFLKLKHLKYIYLWFVFRSFRHYKVFRYKTIL